MITAQAVEAVDLGPAGRPGGRPADGHGVRALRGRVPGGAVPAAHRLKKRPQAMPVALLAADLDAVLDAVPELRGRAAVAARALLPGPTRSFSRIPRAASAGCAGRGPRRSASACPGCRPGARRGRPRRRRRRDEREPPRGARPARLEDIPQELRRRRRDRRRGELPGTPSTVVDLTAPEPRCLREGAVPAAEALERARAAPV